MNKMKFITALIIIALIFVSSVEAQKRKKKTSRPPAAKKEPVKPEPPRIIGSQVVITTKNGDTLKGELLDLSAYSLKLRSDKLESTMALETISAISFGPVSRVEPEKPAASVRPEFARDADQMIRALIVISSGAKAGADYTDYGHLLADFRRQAERFIQKYSRSESLTEIRAVALVSGALTDYTWARTIWTLKLGRAGDSTVSETDSPVVSDVLILYPDLRAAGDRLPADRLIGGLWKKASEKLDQARSLVK
ncbi:MAG: hypothetical protein AB1631_16495 [Acidobacteriota bacterium]